MIEKRKLEEERKNSIKERKQELSKKRK